jgi:release factor glutamine methyltransferase
VTAETDRSREVELAYETGRRKFMSIDLLVAPGALVPRAETEILGNAAVERLRALDEPEPWVIDMCCGSGNLASAIAVHVPRARVWASDLTDGAVVVARQNVAALGLGGRVTVVQGDLFAPLGGLGLEGRIDLVVCNPPYISTARLAKDRALLLEHEPREAFDGGPYGLTIHQRVIKEALAFLKTGGYLSFEIGEGQERQVSLLFERSRAYHPIEQRADAASQPRVISAKKKET